MHTCFFHVLLFFSQPVLHAGLRVQMFQAAGALRVRGGQMARRRRKNLRGRQTTRRRSRRGRCAADSDILLLREQISTPLDLSPLDLSPLG